MLLVRKHVSHILLSQTEAEKAGFRGYLDVALDERLGLLQFVFGVLLHVGDDVVPDVGSFGVPLVLVHLIVVDELLEVLVRAMCVELLLQLFVVEHLQKVDDSFHREVRSLASMIALELDEVFVLCFVVYSNAYS